MEIDKKMIMNRLDSLGDEELKQIVRSVAQCAGVSDRKAEKALSDIKKVRKGLAGMSENDLSRALSSVDEETLESIKNQLNS